MRDPRSTLITSSHPMIVQSLPGYAWIFPLGHGAYNLGVACFLGRNSHPQVNIRKALAAFVTNFPLARDLLREGILHRLCAAV